MFHPFLKGIYLFKNSPPLREAFHTFCAVSRRARVKEGLDAGSV